MQEIRKAELEVKYANDSRVTGLLADLKSLYENDGLIVEVKSKIDRVGIEYTVVLVDRPTKNVHIYKKIYQDGTETPWEAVDLTDRG